MYISLALEDNRSVTHLNLANNALQFDGVDYLIGILDSNTTLEEINLSGNMIDSGVLDEINALLNKGCKSKSKEMKDKNDGQSQAGRLSSDNESEDEALLYLDK